MTSQEIEAAALKLPIHERAKLAEMLIASLEDEWSDAWAAEADRRYDELRSGTAAGIPTEEVFARIRARPR